MVFMPCSFYFCLARHENLCKKSDKRAIHYFFLTNIIPRAIHNQDISNEPVMGLEPYMGKWIKGTYAMTITDSHSFMLQILRMDSLHSRSQQSLHLTYFQGFFCHFNIYNFSLPNTFVIIALNLGPFQKFALLSISQVKVVQQNQAQH